jgi:dTDP-4-dehydrorhamnose reductase
MKHYIILGKGYVGTALSRAFYAAGFNFDAYAQKERDYTQPFIFKQILDETLQKTFTEEITVINCAGYTGIPNVDNCEELANKPNVWKLNALLPANLAAVCKSYYKVNFIHISSGCIYNGYNKLFTETDVPNFGIYENESSFYSKSKHMSEILLKELNFGAILRVRMIFGPDLEPRNFLSKIKKYTHLICQENSMTSVVDLADFIVKFTNRNLEREHDIYNVVNEGSVSLKVVTCLFNKYESLRQVWYYITEQELKLKAKRSNCILDTTKIRDLDLALPAVVVSLDNCIKKIQ